MYTAEVMPLPTAARRHTTHLFSNLEQAGFDTAAYSRMKFGSGADARVLGREMAAAFAAEFWPLLQAQQAVVVPAPSTSVPVAATLMGWHFHNHLNHLLDSSGVPPVQWDLVHRAVTYNDDYATRSLEERRQLLADDMRYVNQEFLAGKLLIFVDDVRITGTHEEKLSYMLHERGLHNPVIFATYAAYTGAEPAIEHQLNRVAVQNGLCVAHLSRQPEWSVTTRGLRLLLELDAHRFNVALSRMELLRMEQVYHACIAKGYSTHQPYAGNFSTLRSRVCGAG